MKDVGGFPLELLPTVRIPGLPPGGELATSAAELNGIELPWYTMGEAASIFFQKSRRWLRKRLNTIDLPDLGDPLYFSAPIYHGGNVPKGGTVMRWSLGEIERMTCWLLQARVIDYRQYIIARQIVAWTARGHGAFDG